MIKQTLRKALRSFGYDLSRFGPSCDSAHEIKKLLSDQDELVIFDVGAHHGQTARQFSKAFPRSSLYCFEPFLDSFEELKKNSSHYPSAMLERIGFSDCDGPQEFYSNEGSPTNSLLKLEGDASRTWGNSALSSLEKVSCEFKTLDHYLDEKKIPQIDLLKLDVQGAEYKVLKGAQASLLCGRIRHLYMEIIVAQTYEGQQRLGDYLNLLDALGFRVQGLFNFVHGLEREILQLDALFSKK